MLLLHEKVVLQNGILEIELHEGFRYRLRYGELVEYENHRRSLRGRTAAYRFRSVEQLRYDFEQDVKAMGGSLAEDA